MLFFTFALHSYFATLFFITTHLELEIPNSTFHVGYAVNDFNKKITKHETYINILVVIMLIVMQWVY